MRLPMCEWHLTTIEREARTKALKLLHLQYNELALCVCVSTHERPNARQQLHNTTVIETKRNKTETRTNCNWFIHLIKFNQNWKKVLLKLIVVTNVMGENVAFDINRIWLRWLDDVKLSMNGFISCIIQITPARKHTCKNQQRKKNNYCAPNNRKNKRKPPRREEEISCWSRYKISFMDVMQSKLCTRSVEASTRYSK